MITEYKNYTIEIKLSATGSFFGKVQGLVVMAFGKTEEEVLSKVKADLDFHLGIEEAKKHSKPLTPGQLEQGMLNGGDDVSLEAALRASARKPSRVQYQTVEIDGDLYDFEIEPKMSDQWTPLQRQLNAIFTTNHS